MPVYEKARASSAMRRSEFIALLGSAAMAMPAAAGGERAKIDGPVAEHLAGTWRFVSSRTLRAEGGAFERWDPDANGVLMFDGHGHFAQIVIGGLSRIFGAKSFSAFGTYSIDEANQTIVTHVEASSRSSLGGTTQRRVVTLLTSQKLIYINVNPASGLKVEAVWTRHFAP